MALHKTTVKIRIKGDSIDSYEAEEAIDEYEPVKFGTGQKIVGCTPDDADSIGWAHYGATAAGKQCDVVLNVGNGTIIPVEVAASSTATAGKSAVGVNGGGYKNGPALSDGSTLAIIRGKFLSSGTAGQTVSMLVYEPKPIFTA